jgi:predicted anti-sigma-YlaC factor YlaD
MNCKKIQNNLISFLEKRLTPEEEKEFRLHLETCKECSQLFAEVTETYQTTDIKEVIEPRAFFAESVLRKIYKEEESREYSDSLFENIFYKYFKEILYSGLAFIMVLMLVFYISEGTIAFNFFSDSDYFSASDVSGLFLDN